MTFLSILKLRGNVIKLKVAPRQNCMVAITHPADASLGDPLFRKRERGLLNFF